MPARFIVVLILLCAFLHDPTILAAPPPDPTQAGPLELPQVLDAQASQLKAIASDAEALAYLTAHLGPALQIQEVVVDIQTPARAGKAGSDALRGLRAEMVESTTRLVASLAAWYWIDRIAQAAQGEEKDGLRLWLDQSASARKWLGGDGPGAPLARLSATAEKLAAVGEAYPAPAATSSTPPCTDYAGHLDRAYPALTGPAPSWVAILELEGVAGLKARLEDQSFVSGLSLSHQRSCARSYLDSRLLPVFRASLSAQTLTARAEIEREARRLALSLQRWPERKRETIGLTRLCGTWQWTIHNHRHHQESKTTMTFPPPDGPPPPGLRPSKMVVLGDAVYIRWDFQGGFQEESLLLGGEGARLEGTFINSTGAWGSITGKRIATCPK